MRISSILFVGSLLLIGFAPHAHARLQSGEVPIWQVQEINLAAARQYANPYVEVECWVDLEGPGFKRRVSGFWDGGRTFKVRIVATHPGEWSWRVGSNHAEDSGLAGAGKFRAVAWSAEDLAANPNRRGFIRATDNGHALRYADDTPFFLTGDTWLAASTWRLPFKGTRAAADYVPARRHQLRRGSGVAQTAGIQFHLVHRRVSELGRGRTRRHLRQQGRRVPAQRLGKVRVVGAECDDFHPRRSHDHRERHARRAGQPAVRSIRRS